MKNGKIPVSKCCSPESKKAAYAIIEEYAKLLRPKELAAYLEEHIVKLLNSVDRPAKFRHKPSSGGRVHQHCGITNLGCICYMISMLQ